MLPPRHRPPALRRPSGVSARPAASGRARRGASSAASELLGPASRQPAANTSPRRASSTATTSLRRAPRRRRRPAPATRASRRPTSGMPGARERPRRGDPDPQARERAGADADRDPVEPVPADPGALEHVAIRASSRVVWPGRVRRPAGRRAPKTRSPTPKGDRVAGSPCRTPGSSRSMRHQRAGRSPACSRSSPCAATIASRARRSSSPPSGPFDERDRVGAEVVGQQVGVLAAETGRDRGRRGTTGTGAG